MKEAERAPGTRFEADERTLRALAEEHGQGHVFSFWRKLQPPERASLLEQLKRVDFKLMDLLAKEHVHRDSKPEAGKLSPAPIIPVPETEEARRETALARQVGEELLRRGKVAAFVVAGGQGTRLGLDGPKGKFEIGPVTRRTFFQLHAEKIKATSRRYAATIPWYVMTADCNHEATVSYFEQCEFFGLGKENLYFLEQESIPAVDREGKFLLESPSRLFTSPNGHGGSLQALHRSGALADMRRRGIELIFYFQVDNPLLVMCDPVFLGHHARAEAEMSSKVVRKASWREKVGVYGLLDGKLSVIEYSDLPEAEATATLPDGSLRYWAGSIAIHTLSVDFVERLNEGGLRLPYHRAEKEIPFVNEQGELVRPPAKNGIKFELFVFDALREARRSVTVAARREDEFSPVKNATGEDSPETSRRDLTALYLRWLEAAGARIEREADGSFRGHVEISPLTALDALDLQRRLKPGTAVRPGFIL